MYIRLKGEQNFKSWILRLICGPAGIIDAMVSTLTLGVVSTGLTLYVARELAKARINWKPKK